MTSKQKKNFLINLLRAGTFKWRPRGEARKRYRTPWGKFKNGKTRYGYFCAKCRDIFLTKNTQMDHLHAVVSPVEGYTTLDNYADRMFCDEDGWVCLCISCHNKKSQIEKDFRVMFRKINGENSRDLDLEKEYYLFLKEYTS